MEMVPLQEPQPLLHADQAKPSTRFCCFAVKAYARVTHHKMNLIQRSPQSHFDVPCPTVFYRIVEGLLQDSEKAKRNVPAAKGWANPGS